MKKISTILFLAGFVFLFFNCGGASNPKAVMMEFVDTLDNYITDMSKSENVDQGIAVCEKYTKKFAVIKEKLEKIKEQNPEAFEAFKSKKGEMPEEYKDVEKRMKEVMPKMMQAIGKIMKYSKDQRFNEANRELQKSMTLN